MAFSPKQSSKNLRAVIGNKEINIEVVTKSADMERGLGYRKSLDQNSGMLFSYVGYVRPSYWMKGMEFPLDMIWIGDDKVIGYEQNVPVVATGMLPTYAPKELINMVLEVNAGFVQTNSIKIGDSLIIHN